MNHGMKVRKKTVKIIRKQVEGPAWHSYAETVICFAFCYPLKDLKRQHWESNIIGFNVFSLGFPISYSTLLWKKNKLFFSNWIVVHSFFLSMEKILLLTKQLNETLTLLCINKLRNRIFSISRFPSVFALNRYTTFLCAMSVYCLRVNIVVNLIRLILSKCITWSFVCIHGFFYIQYTLFYSAFLG